jgi:hypothetical protein
VPDGFVPDWEDAAEVVSSRIDEAADLEDPLLVEPDHPEPGVVVGDVAEVLLAGVGLDLVDGQDAEPASEGGIERLWDGVGADDREVGLGGVVQVQVAPAVRPAGGRNLLAGC